MERMPYFCAGCPHNSSTHIPEGSRALSGIGCHYLAQFMDRSTARYTQMGGEGSSWIGQSRFSRRKHVFQNIGDGTYFHSGLLSIRAAVSAGTDITFKILYNDAVAMTGGQAVDGPISVPIITRQMHSEGVKRIAVVTDQPEKYGSDAGFAPGNQGMASPRSRYLATQVSRDPRNHGDRLRPDLRCGKTAAPQARQVPRSCDAGVHQRGGLRGMRGLRHQIQLRCRGARRNRIRTQAGDRSILLQQGFLLRRGLLSEFRHRPRWPLAQGGIRSPLDGYPRTRPAPPRSPLSDHRHRGWGGTGVLTIGALLGMAAHLESKGCSILDQTGLAQKRRSGGKPRAHRRFPFGYQRHARRLRLRRSGDRLRYGGYRRPPAPAAPSAREARWSVVNTHQTMTGAFTRDVDLLFPSSALMRDIEGSAGPEFIARVEATSLATALCGDAIAANMFMLGYAWQHGRIPLSRAAIVRAIELNGVAVRMNLGAFEWGRCAAADIDAVARLANKAKGVVEIPAPQNEEALIERRAAFLDRYQNRALADRYLALIERVRHAERTRAKGLRGPHRGGGQGPFQTPGLQRRIRGRPLAFLRGIPAAPRSDLRRRLLPRLPPGPTADRPPRSRHRRTPQDAIRPMDDESLRLPRKIQRPARHPPSTPSATPRSAARNEP